MDGGEAGPGDAKDTHRDGGWDIPMPGRGLEGLFKSFADDVIHFDLRGAACQLFAKLLGGILGVCGTGFEVGDVRFGIPDHAWKVADCFIDGHHDAGVELCCGDVLLQEASGLELLLEICKVAFCSSFGGWRRIEDERAHPRHPLVGIELEHRDRLPG